MRAYLYVFVCICVCVIFHSYPTLHTKPLTQKHSRQSLTLPTSYVDDLRQNQLSAKVLPLKGSISSISRYLGPVMATLMISPVQVHH